MAKYSAAVVKLVVARLEASSPNVSVAIGIRGSFTRNQLIKEVKSQTEVGTAVIRMELEFIKNMPTLASTLTK